MERKRVELLPGVYLTALRDQDAPTACFRLALLSQLNRETAAMNALLPDTLLQGKDIPAETTVTPLVRKIGEIQAAGFAAEFPNREDAVAPTAALLHSLLLQPDTHFGQLKKESVERALALREEHAAAQDDPFQSLAEHMCCYEDYAIPVLGEDPEAGPNYYQKLSKHFKEWLAESPVELFYSGTLSAKDAAQVFAETFAALPRGELEFDLGTDIRMNSVEEEPRFEDRSGPQGPHRIGVGWRLGETMLDPEPWTLEAMTAMFWYLGRGVEPNMRLDVHKGSLLAVCDIDPEDAPITRAGLDTVMDTVRMGGFSNAALDAARKDRIAALRAIPESSAALERWWLEQDLLGLELAPEEYAAFTEEATRADIVAVSAGIECDAILLE